MIEPAMYGFTKLMIVCAGVCGFALALALTPGVMFRTFRHPSGSMEPAIRIGETIVVKRTKDVSRGDIVAFRYRQEPRTIFAKRAIAIGGDTVEIRDKKLILNGVIQNEPYVQHMDDQIYPSSDFMPEPYRSRDQFGPLQIPPAEIFVLGDNRDQSYDSRYWGPVARDAVIGKAIATFSWRRGFRSLR